VTIKILITKEVTAVNPLPKFLSGEKRSRTVLVPITPILRKLSQ